MGDEEEIQEEMEDEEVLSGAPVSGGRSKLVTMLMWGAGVVIGVLLMFVISYLVAKKVKSDAFKEEQNIVIAPAPPPLATYTFPKEFRVNTADIDEPHFIQLSLAFGYKTENKALEKELIDRQTQMMHIINIILGGKKKEDLQTQLQKLNLAEEVKSQINMILSEGKIEEVYFQEIVIS